MPTVAGAESTAPSFTAKEKVSFPEKPVAGV
jgi:hypothetical protein